MVKSLAHEAIYDAAEAMLRDVPRGRLLDVPAGEGALAQRLLALGFDVHCCDLYPQIFGLPGVEIRQGDLSATLPYEDASFDHVVCVEGLEHIENPHQAVREFARLLRPGGHLVVSVPNILNLEERFKWLLHGYSSHFKPLSREALKRVSREFGGIEEVALHINPISYAELRYILEKYGFSLVEVRHDRPKNGMWLFRPLAFGIRMINRMQSRAKRLERWSDELQSDAVLLGGNTLVVHAVKRGPV
ncbi:MAG: class I SAM-dependent methyltransferase [Pyrinomonadaceae bacterium]